MKNSLNYLLIAIAAIWFLLALPIVILCFYIVKIILIDNIEMEMFSGIFYVPMIIISLIFLYYFFNNIYYIISTLLFKTSNRKHLWNWLFEIFLLIIIYVIYFLYRANSHHLILI